jgi:O-antigen ligase
VRLSYGVVALVVVADQMLLPMFHVAGLPFKPSYLLLGLALLPMLLDSTKHGGARGRTTENWQVAGAIGAIVLAGLAGELWLSITADGAVHAEAARSSVIYLLAVLAFVLGRRASRFRFRWLIYVFLIAVGLNFAFVVLQHRLPGWLTGFYYSQPIGELTVFEFLRPRGLFGNPNVSAHMISILVLFIHLALRHRLLVVSSASLGVAIIAFPILLAAAVASRGELIVAVILGVLNYRVMFMGRALSRATLRRLVVACGLGMVLGAGAWQVARRSEWAGQFLRVVSAVADAERRSSRLEGIARPLLTFEDARDRFIQSPLFGTGFGHAYRYPFDFETKYFHNDWFRLLVTSGMIGLIAMLWFLWRFAWPLGWPILIPLVLPGMINTFMLNIPAFICYFLMIGVLREALLRRSAASVTRGHTVEELALDRTQS